MVKWVGKIILLGVLLVLSGCAAISEPDYAVNSNGDEDAALSAMDQNYLLSYERVVENALPVMDTDNTVGARLMAASLKLSIDDEIEKIKNSASLVVINNLNVSKAVADWFIQNEIRVYQYRCSVTGNELNKIYNTLCVLDKKYICKDIYFADSLPGKNSLGLDTVGFGGSEAILLKIGIYDNWTIAHENGHYIDFGVIGDLSAGFKDISWERNGTSRKNWGFISPYAYTSPAEDFADSVAFFTMGDKKFKDIGNLLDAIGYSPVNKKYEWIKNNVFKKTFNRNESPVKYWQLAIKNRFIPMIKEMRNEKLKEIEKEYPVKGVSVWTKIKNTAKREFYEKLTKAKFGAVIELLGLVD